MPRKTNLFIALSMFYNTNSSGLCPTCKHSLNQASYGDDEDRGSPREGDLSVCFYLTYPARIDPVLLRRSTA